MGRGPKKGRVVKQPWLSRRGNKGRTRKISERVGVKCRTIWVPN